MDSETHLDRNEKMSYRELKHGKSVDAVKIIFFCVLFLALGAYSGNYIGAKTGYSDGYKSGFMEGKTMGYEDGYLVGKDYGWETGWVLGNKQGLDEGYNSGYEVGVAFGYENGLEAGDILGYDAGFTDGFTEGFSENGYQTRDPTYEEMKTFLRRDKTDENRYIAITYDCDDFAADVKKNAYDLGLRCFFVTMEFKSGAGHAVVSFDTTDRGMIFIEPQTDEEIEVAIGAKWQSYEIVSFDIIP